MIEKYINEEGKECYRGVTLDAPFTGNEFHMPKWQPEDGASYAFHTNLGSLTVVDRMTGYGWRDTESGYRDSNGEFWLATGHCDVRSSGCKTVGEAISWVKRLANICIGKESTTQDQDAGEVKNT